MRDIQIISLSDKEQLIIAADNSGAIGMKEKDAVKVPYHLVSYYSFRVAVMECIAAGGNPLSVILQNFCGDKAWVELVNGIKKGIKELGIREQLRITGSTESNFSLNQSAIGVTVLGKQNSTTISRKTQQKFAVIGSPLVGEEVVLRESEVAPLSLFYQLAKTEKFALQPVGSKGILYELKVIGKDVLEDREVICAVDMMKSSGPSTCFIVRYEEKDEEELISYAAPFLHKVTIMK